MAFRDNTFQLCDVGHIITKMILWSRCVFEGLGGTVARI